MNFAQTTIEQQVPLSQVRIHYNDVVKKAKKNGYMLVVKNYIPHSIIMSPDFFFTYLTKTYNQTAAINEQETQRRAKAVNKLLKFRDKFACKIKNWDPLNQLIKDRASR